MMEVDWRCSLAGLAHVTVTGPAAWCVLPTSYCHVLTLASHRSSTTCCIRGAQTRGQSQETGASTDQRVILVLSVPSTEGLPITRGGNAAVRS